MTTSAAAAAGPRLAVVRYMGGKGALLPELLECVEGVAAAGSLVVDPMAGSHAVTHALKHRHRLVASDVQEYSAVIGRAFVENATARRVPADHLRRLRAAVERRLADDAPGFLEREFSDTYLGRDQCRQLDALRATVDDLTPDPADPLRWLTLAALVNAACRGQASPGHFAQFLPPAHPRTLRLRRMDLVDVALESLDRWEVAPGLPGSVSFALPWAELVERHAGALRDAAAWYVDPPYTADQYSRFYHFLETLVRADEPRLSHKARYRDDRFRSAFCSRRTAADELRRLLTAVRRVSPEAAVVLSYSSRGLLSREQLLAATADSFDVAATRDIPHVYSTQGKGRLDGVREWILTLRPR